MTSSIQTVLQKITNSVTLISDRVSSIESRIQSERIRWKDEQISAGVITATSKAIRLEPETGVTDDLDTINNGYDGMVVRLCNKDSGDTITIKDATGNIQLGGSDVTLDDVYDAAELMNDDL